MKTYKNLYSKLCDFENILWAWKKARRGKRYTATAAAFEQNLDSELIALQTELRAETYQPGGYRSFTVHEPKRRKISAAPFRDRVVHHALCNVLTPIWERTFIDDTYANRIGKGTHAALDRCTQFMRRYKYVLPCDVQQFFPAIDHQILKDLLGYTVRCKPTLRLCDKIIDSGIGVLTDEYTMRYFPGDDLFAATRPRGLPIGNLTSQFWANVYLNPLDQFVKHHLRCRGYVRYVDDFLLFADDKLTLLRWKDDIVGFLESLRLATHNQRAQPRPVGRGLTFLGFTVFPTHRLLKRVKGIGYRRHLGALWARRKSGEISLDVIHASMMAWIGHVRHSETWNLRSAMFNAVFVK